MPAENEPPPPKPGLIRRVLCTPDSVWNKKRMRYTTTKRKDKYGKPLDTHYETATIHFVYKGRQHKWPATPSPGPPAI